ncbi:conserved protein of unknown function [Nitrosotalea devaniterrae]|uniref:DUF504 domain-containing protein n=1 Tax=Nitrosotalea devaniterrae TaxID=1078905 RepID=A0A128A2F8_9ARCH|nr:conserved protein of unknown function [Candidatus Nitrosotalea devanaterra]
MTRKGKVADILSNALYNDNPELYQVGYIDFSKTREVPLGEFLKLSENFETIPASRIAYIKKENDILHCRSVRKKDPKI